MKDQIVSVRKAKARPWPIRLYNLLPAGSLDFDDLIRTARRKEKLEDFGPGDFEEPLRRLLQSINEEARLHAFGRMITRIRLINILRNRLRSQYFFKKYPDILAQDSPPIILITGLQRTGTTKLHRLLAAHDAIRALHSWEALNPAPFLPEGSSSQRRIKEARTSERALKYIASDFFAIHPVEHDAPEEEVLLLDNSFISTVPEATMHVPTFASWVEKQDQSPAYEMMLRLIKLLHWQSPAPFWLLKSPHHLEFLGDVFNTFPDVKVIHTHRAPELTLASFCSMVYHSRRIFSDQVSAEEVGKHWSRKVNRMLQRAMDFREKEASAQFLDIYYENLLQKPLDQLEAIYKFRDIPFLRIEQEKAELLLKRNQQHKYGVHRYALEDFGLREEEIKNNFTTYYQRFLNSVNKHD
ncbi:MAG: sulfotransferase [Bacteroidota bacterium]